MSNPVFNINTNGLLEWLKANGSPGEQFALNANGKILHCTINWVEGSSPNIHHPDDDPWR